MDGTSAVAEASSTDVVARRFDALTGWTARAWTWGTVVAAAVGAAVAASGHLLVGVTWVLLAGAALGVRSVFGAHRTSVGPSSVTVQGIARTRTVAAGEVRRVVVVHPELAGSRVVVHGTAPFGVAVPVEAVARDAALAAALRRFLAHVPPGAAVDPELDDLLGPVTAR